MILWLFRIKEYNGVYLKFRTFVVVLYSINLNQSTSADYQLHISIPLIIINVRTLINQ